MSIPWMLPCRSPATLAKLLSRRKWDADRLLPSTSSPFNPLKQQQSRWCEQRGVEVGLASVWETVSFYVTAEFRLREFWSIVITISPFCHTKLRLNAKRAVPPHTPKEICDVLKHQHSYGWQMRLSLTPIINTRHVTVWYDIGIDHCPLSALWMLPLLQGLILCPLWIQLPPQCLPSWYSRHIPRRWVFRPFNLDLFFSHNYGTAMWRCRVIFFTQSTSPS